MKSLLIVTEAFEVGGLETHIKGEIVSLARAGCSVHLATGKQFNGILIPQEVSSVSNTLLLGPEATATDFIDTVNALRQIIRDHDIECIHAHPFTSLLPSLITAELEEVPFVLTLHGPASLFSYLGSLYDFILSSLILPSADLVVGVSEEVADLASPYLKQGEVFILPNGVNVNALSPTITPREIDPRWLVACRLDFLKIVGVADFIKKAKSAGLPGVLLVGDGPGRKELQQRLYCDGILDFVEFYGISADVPKLMQSTAGVAGMGRVVLEGLACQKPVCLVGYDGVKGIVDQDLLWQAARYNFSGRNLKSIDEQVFNRQINQLQRINVTDLYRAVSEKFSEPALWAHFAEKIASVTHKTSTLLRDIYRCLLTKDIKGTEPLLQSVVFIEQVGRLIHSARHFELSIAASFLYHREKFIVMKFNEQTLAREIAERDRRVQELAREIDRLDAHAQALAREVVERDNHAQELAKEVVQRDNHAQELAKEVRRLNEQLQIELNKTLRQRIKRIIEKVKRP